MVYLYHRVGISWKENGSKGYSADLKKTHIVFTFIEIQFYTYIINIDFFPFELLGFHGCL